MNSQYFSKEEIAAGLHHKLIDFLIEQSYADQGDIRYYNDIRIVPEDLGAVSVQWESVCWKEYGEAKWQWVNEDQRVFTDYRFPDGHYEYCADDEDFRERLFAAEEQEK